VIAWKELRVIRGEEEDKGSIIGSIRLYGFAPKLPNKWLDNFIQGAI